MASTGVSSSVPVRFSDLLRVFLRIGLLSFGGPAGQIALMHRELVEERRWVGEDDFLHALNFCHLLPGPEAQQLATWIGWRLHGWRGGLAAGVLFVIPGALVILALSMLYAAAADLELFQALFLGIKAAVLAIVVQALLRIAGRAVDTGFKRALAVAAFVGIFLLDLPFPVIVLGSGVLGMVVAAVRPDWLSLKPSSSAGIAAPRPWRSSLIAVGVWGAIWAAPLVLVAATLGPDHVLWDIGAFFSQLAVVTFGGAYAVLAYMAQEAVQGFGWLQPGEMADGLGLAHQGMVLQRFQAFCEIGADVVMNALDQLGHEFVRHRCCVANEAAKTPEDRIQLTDNSVLLKFEQSRDGHLRVHVLSNGSRVITTRSKLQIGFFNFDWDLSETEITGR